METKTESAPGTRKKLQKKTQKTQKTQLFIQENYRCGKQKV